MTLTRRAPLGLLAVLALAGALTAQATVVPTDVQEPGTQPLQIANLQTPDKCDNCHGGYAPAVEPAHNWRGSMMAQAGRDPLFWATVAVAERDVSGSGDLCLRCHAAEGWLAGRSTPTDGSGLQSGDSHGVSCDLCHRLTNPDLSEWLGVQVAPFLAHDDALPPQGWYGSGMYVVWANQNEKLGPYANAVPPHPFLQSVFHRSAKLCGTCHDVSNPAVGDLAPWNGAQLALPPGSFSGVPGAPVDGKAAFNNPPFAFGVVERTSSEHAASGFDTLRVADYATLPAELKDGAIEAAWQAAIAANPTGDYVDGTPRFFTCQTCHMAPVTGKGCNKQGAPVRTDLPLHDLTGGNVWAPDAIEWLDASGQLKLGGGLSASEESALADGQARALKNLQRAASLAVVGDTLRVTNLTGHKLLSGYPEGRRAWLNVRWYDDAELLLREDGAYGDVAVKLQGQPLMVRSLLQLDPPDTRIYEAHYAVTQEWAARLLGWGWPGTLPVAFDRLTGAVTATLASVAAQAPGTWHESFHFVINDRVASDVRIPPWGFAYDEARVRNALPVPADEYGDPGPGGNYDHWDEVALSPPTGATHADIRLLYQPTSWEYVQFLVLANAGGSVFLADTGTDLLAAWQATGMAEPVEMASATWTGVGPTDPWADLGFGLAGSSGVPHLEGSGTLVGGTPVSFTLTHAKPASSTTLVIGLSAIDAPFKGGTLVPKPDALLLGLPTGTGTLTLSGTWPTGLPSGLALSFQHWIVDAAGPKGLAASNGLQGTTP
jgi:hypothetical protein